MNLLCTFFFAFFLWALSLYNAYKNIRNERDEAREDSRKGAYERCDIHIKLRDTENQLFHANEKLQNADSDMNEERRDFRNTIQGLDDQHRIDQEEIRSLAQDVWNTESDRDGYSRQVFQVSNENQKLKSDLSEAIYQRDLAEGEGQTLQEDLSEANRQRDLAQAEVQTLQENLAEVNRQLDLARGEVQTLSMEPQQGQATSVITTLKARPKPRHRRTQRPSSLPKTHKKLLLKGPKAAKPSTSSSAGPQSPPNLIGENLSKGYQATLAERDQIIKDLREQRQHSTVQASAELEQMLGERAPEELELEASTTVKDQKIRDLEQEKETLTAQIGGMRTDLEKLSDEHGECSGHLHTQLAGKDEEIRNLQAENATADKDSVKIIATLRTELGEKEKEVADLEEANGTLVAEPAPCAGTVQRLNTLSNELEKSRLAHAQCDENSTSQNSRIGQLVIAKEQLEEMLRVKDGEIQGRVTPLHNELAELQKIHARCTEHAITQGLKLTQLRNANGSLQITNNELSQQLGTARDEHANLVREGQRVENQNEALLDLQSCSRREIRSLQGQIEALNQTVDHQQQRIQILETNCPNCQKLREALDEVAKDVEMSDDNTRDEMRREVRAELRSQVADDLRRQIKGEVECEVGEKFRNHYSDQLAHNSKRIREQDRLLLEKDTELEKAKNAPTVNHAACEKRELNLQSSVTKLQQDAKIAQRNNSRLSGDAKHDREQLNHAQTVVENLRHEVETMRADQRRAQSINPLQSKLTTCQRELSNMKDDRKKARDNCGIYSNQLSDLRKKHKVLENELAAFRGKSSLDGDSMMDNGRAGEPAGMQDEQRKAISALHNEVARLSKELEERKARDSTQDQAMDEHDTPSGTQSLPAEEGEQQWPEGSFPDDQSSTGTKMDKNEVAALNVLRYEVEARGARGFRDRKIKAGCTQPAASTGPTVRSGGVSSSSSAHGSDDEADDKPSLPTDGGEKSDDELEEGEILGTKPASKPASKPARRSGRRIARRPTTKPILGGGVGMKRRHDECSDGEADDEGDDDRKKMRLTVIEDGMHRLKASEDISVPAQSDNPQDDKDMA